MISVGFVVAQRSTVVPPDETQNALDDLALKTRELRNLHPDLETRILELPPDEAEQWIAEVRAKVGEVKQAKVRVALALADSYRAQTTSVEILSKETKKPSLGATSEVVQRRMDAAVDESRGLDQIVKDPGSDPRIVAWAKEQQKRVAAEYDKLKEERELVTQYEKAPGSQHALDGLAAVNRDLARLASSQVEAATREGQLRDEYLDALLDMVHVHENLRQSTLAAKQPESGLHQSESDHHKAAPASTPSDPFVGTWIGSSERTGPVRFAKVILTIKPASKKSGELTIDFQAWGARETSQKAVDTEKPDVKYRSSEKPAGGELRFEVETKVRNKWVGTGILSLGKNNDVMHMKWDGSPFEFSSVNPDEDSIQLRRVSSNATAGPRSEGTGTRRNQDSKPDADRHERNDLSPVVSPAVPQAEPTAEMVSRPFDGSWHCAPCQNDRDSIATEMTSAELTISTPVDTSQTPRVTGQMKVRYRFRDHSRPDLPIEFSCDGRQSSSGFNVDFECGTSDGKLNGEMTLSIWGGGKSLSATWTWKTFDTKTPQSADVKLERGRLEQNQRK